MNVKHVPRKFKVGDLIAEKGKPNDIGFVTKVDRGTILIRFLHGKYAGKVFNSHKDWLIHVDDIIIEEEE